MLEYLDSILIPYVASKRDELQNPNQAALLICDVFAAHRVASFREKLEANDIQLIYVPAGCTGRLGYSTCRTTFII